MCICLIWNKKSIVEYPYTECAGYVIYGILSVITTIGIYTIFDYWSRTVIF